MGFRFKNSSLFGLIVGAAIAIVIVSGVAGVIVNNQLSALQKRTDDLQKQSQATQAAISLSAVQTSQAASQEVAKLSATSAAMATQVIALPLPTHTPLPTKIPTNTPAENTAIPIATPSPTAQGCKWEVQIFNVSGLNDIASIYLNNAKIASVPDKGILQDTKWIDLSSRMASNDENIIRFTSFVRERDSSWGFKLRSLGKEVAVDQNSSPGSINDVGGVFDKSYLLSNDCKLKKLETTSSKWELQISPRPIYVNGTSIFFDGAMIYEDKEKKTINLSPYIIKNRDHVISITSDNSYNINFIKNGKTIFSNSFDSFKKTFNFKITADDLFEAQ